jgi:hypothetical protein
MFYHFDRTDVAGQSQTTFFLVGNSAPPAGFRFNFHKIRVFFAVNRCFFLVAPKPWRRQIGWFFLVFDWACLVIMTIPNRVTSPRRIWTAVADPATAGGDTAFACNQAALVSKQRSPASFVIRASSFMMAVCQYL